MPAIAIGLGLALAASLSQSGGYLFQHLSAAVRPPVSIRRPIRTLEAMLTAPWWRVGLMLAIAGFLLHLAALALAPISLVQAFVAGGLAMAVPLAARVFGHHLTRSETRAVFLMAASLAALSSESPNRAALSTSTAGSSGSTSAVCPCSRRSLPLPLTGASVTRPSVWRRACSTASWTAPRRR